MPNESQLLTLEGREWVLKKLERQDLVVCKRGFLDIEEGIPVYDETVMKMLLEKERSVEQSMARLAR